VHACFVILDASKAGEICVYQLQTLKEHEMKRIALVAALLALALTACGKKPAEAPAAAVVAPTPAASAPAAADTMKK